MISSQDFENTQKVATELVKKYKNFGGVYNWEYFTSPPHNQSDPSLWARIMAKILGLSKKGFWEINIRPWIDYFFS